MISLFFFPNTFKKIITYFFLLHHKKHSILDTPHLRPSAYIFNLSYKTILHLYSSYISFYTALSKKLAFLYNLQNQIISFYLKFIRIHYFKFHIFCFLEPLCTFWTPLRGYLHYFNSHFDIL